MPPDNDQIAQRSEMSWCANSGSRRSSFYITAAWSQQFVASDWSARCAAL